MDKLIFILLFTFCIQNAYADESNLLKNSGFESRISRWSKIGSGTFTIESSNPLDDTYSGKWDASASGEFFRSSLYTIPFGMKASTCVLEMKYLWDSGSSGDILLNVDDGTNNIASLSLEPTSGGISRKAFVPFTCPSTGGIRLELESTADAAEITLDATFLGNGRGTILEKPQDVFSAELSASGVVTAENLDWITGSCTNATPMVCTFKTDLFSQAPNCQITAKDSITNTTCQVDQTSATSSIRCYSSNDANQTQVVKKILSCQKVESSANREALTLDTTGSNWSGYHDNTCSWSRTNTAYGDPAVDATCALVERKNSGFGSVTSYESGGDALPGIVFTPKITGTYYVCATPRYRATGASEQIGFKLWDGSSTIVEGKEFQLSVATSRTGPSLCGLYDVSSISPVTISIQTKIAAGAIILEETASTTDAAIEWSIFPITQQFPAPVFTEVQNKSNARESGIFEVSAKILNSGIPTLGSDLGNWVDSLVDNATGDTTINITAGVFSQAPHCWCTSEKADDGNCNIDPTTATSSTLVRVQTEVAASGTDEDQNFHILCRGK